MAAVITHAFVNPKSDGPDNTIARPGDWNANHVITGRTLLKTPIALGLTNFTLAHGLGSTYTCLVGWSATWPTMAYVASVGSTSMNIVFTTPATTNGMFFVSNLETIT